MVIDWKRQIDRCIEEKRVIPIFHGGRQAISYEHILIIKRLSGAGYSDSQILEWMREAGSELIHDEWSLEALKKDVAAWKMPKEHDFTIYVTQAELDYIEALDATKEQKTYLLSYICFLKLMTCKTKRAVLKDHQEAFIYWLAFGSDDYRAGKHRSQSIEPFMKRLVAKKALTLKSQLVTYTRYTEHGPVKEMISCVVVKVPWAVMKASEGIKITVPEKEIGELAAKSFSEDAKICKCCGTPFPCTGYTRRNLCEACYLEDRKRQKRECKRLHNKR